jgi:hypothetical protein
VRISPEAVDRVRRGDADLGKASHVDDKVLKLEERRRPAAQTGATDDAYGRDGGGLVLLECREHLDLLVDRRVLAHAFPAVEDTVVGETAIIHRRKRGRNLFREK